MLEYNRKYEFQLIILFFFVWGFIFLDRSALSYIMPTLIEDLQLSNGQVGQINMWQTIGFALFGPIIAIFSDKTGNRKTFLIVTMIATSIFSAVSAFANSYASLLIIRFLVGASEGPILALVMTIMATASAPGRYGRNAGIINAGVGVVAYILGPVLITQLISKVDWHWTFILISVPSLLLAILCLVMVKERKSTRKTNVQQQQTKTPIWELFKYRNIVFCILISISCMSAYWILMTFGPVYLTSIGNYSIEAMGLVFSIMGIAGILTAISLPLLSDYFGRRKVLVFFGFLAMLAPLSLYLFPTSWIGIVGLILFGPLLGSLIPIYVNIIPEESLPATLITTASAFIIGVGEIGGSLVLGATSTLSNTFGLPFVLLVGASGATILALLSLALKETKKNERTSREFQEVDIVKMPN